MGATTATAAFPFASAGHRADLPAQEESRSPSHPGWAQAASLQAALDRRTHHRLGNFRRLVVRYDRSLTIYGAFFHIACFMIVLRRVLQ